MRKKKLVIAGCGKLGNIVADAVVGGLLDGYELAGQSNAMAYGEGLPLPDSYDAPHPRIKQLVRIQTPLRCGVRCVRPAAV